MVWCCYCAVYCSFWFAWIWSSYGYIMRIELWNIWLEMRECMTLVQKICCCIISVFLLYLIVFSAYSIQFCSQFPKKNQSIKLKHEFIIWFNCFKTHVQNTSFTIKWKFCIFHFYHIAHWNVRAEHSVHFFLIWKSTITDSQLL